MPRSSFRRYLPDPQKLREHRALKPLGKWLQNPEIWHFHRRSVAGAAFIGLFVSFLPVPMHMLIAAAIAIATRCNLPLAVGMVWVNNPLTMGPLFFFAYKLGAWLMNTPPMVTEVHIDLGWLGREFDRVWWPLVLGSLVCGWVSGITAYAIVRVGWRMRVVRRWRERANERRARAASNATSQQR
jgi:uncharacterized protein (DUF2062 family)